MHKNNSQQPNIRFRSLDQLEGYLERAGDTDLSFRLYPISGSPETFRYTGRDKTITRMDDSGRTFDSLRDFSCYVFQCDDEGYSHTEYVDCEMLD